MKSIKINLLLIFAIANFLIPVKSGVSWVKTDVLWPGCQTACTSDYVAKRMWIYSNIAYCSERSVDAQTCVPCQENNIDRDDYAKSWSLNGAFVFVYYDKIINKVVVTFRGTEGLAAIENWRTNLDFISTVVQCIPLKAKAKVYRRLARNNKNKQSKNKLGIWPFSETTLAATETQPSVATGEAQPSTTTKVASALWKKIAGVTYGGYQILEHTAQLTVGNSLQFVRQKVGNTYHRLTADDYSCFMHHGFWGNTDGLMKKKIFIQTKWYTIEEYVRELYQLKNANGVSFTGHSLGGAMATVAASSFLYQQIKQINSGKKPDILVASLYTYGSPQVGDVNFQQWFDQSCDELKVKNYRLRYNNDAVTNSLGFSHIGNLIRYDNITKTYTDCKQWTAKNPTQGENDPQCQLKGLTSLSIADHSGYFEGEVLIDTVEADGKIKSKKCDMRQDQEAADDRAYQLEKSAKEQADAKEAGLISMNRFRKNHKKFFNAKKRQHTLSNK